MAAIDKWIPGPPVNEFVVKDSGQRLQFASGSLRDTAEGKLKWSRILFGPMAKRWAWHLTKAEVKYPDPMPGVPNFTLIETDEELARYRESALRHFMQWWEGETDEDHAAAVYFNINGVEIIKGKRAARATEPGMIVKATEAHWQRSAQARADSEPSSCLR
jgi:hypothetical protein